MGVLSKTLGLRAAAVYYHFRALHCSAPSSVASANIVAIIDKYLKTGKTLQVLVGDEATALSGFIFKF